jgi:diguanylate cyclase (GGDEF)-like protein
VTDPTESKTARKAPTGKLEADRLDLAGVLEGAAIAVYRWTVESDALTWSAGASAILAMTAQDLASLRSFSRHVEAGSGCALAEAANTPCAANERVPYELHYAVRTANGVAWLDDSGHFETDAVGNVRVAEGVVRVVTERHAREARLEQLARHDELTGQLNRATLNSEIEARLAACLDTQDSFGFALVSVDGLSRINEAYGFDVADDVLAATAQRLRSVTRRVDHVARFSGNKFGVLLTECTLDQMPVAAERLLACVRAQPVPTAAGPLPVTVTIGGVVAPRHARTLRELIARAHEALAVARARRHGTFHAYVPNPEREQRRVENIRATDEIVRALNDRRVAIAFEPVVDARTRAVRFHECLMRLREDGGELRGAGAIVPRAERLGLTHLIDHRVLELAAAELFANREARLAVNVSASSVSDPHWSQTLAHLVRAVPDAATRLIVEITESSAIHHLDDTIGFVRRVKDLGCQVAIDDFGAGYTSFGNLRRLGVDMVKIDGAFVENMSRSADDRLFVRTLIDLASGLGLQTVAEWVQDEEAARNLTDWGCTWLQGHLFGRATAERSPSLPSRRTRRRKAA